MADTIYRLTHMERGCHTAFVWWLFGKHPDANHLCGTFGRTGVPHEPPNDGQAVVCCANMTPVDYERPEVIEAWRPYADRLRDVLLLRDPFNMMASSITWWATGRQIPAGPLSMPNIDPDFKYLEIWKSQAREFVGQTHYLIHNPVMVSANRWAKDADYRAQIAELLGMEGPGDGPEDVMGGSYHSAFPPTYGSVRQNHPSHAARDLDIENRWQALWTPVGLKMFFDRECFALSREALGYDPLEGMS